MTITLTVTDSPTASATPLPLPFSLSVELFNSAGERVRVLYGGLAAFPLTQAQVTVSGPQADGSPVRVDIRGLGLPGLSDLVWNGTNDAGQRVQNGGYYLQITAKDAFGQATSLDKPVQVLGTGGDPSLQIYNSAGEVVRTLDLSALPSLPVDAQVVRTPGQGALAVGTDPATGAPVGGVPLRLTLADGSVRTVVWDGRADGGQPLRSGSYLVQLAWIQAGRSSLVKSLPLTLLETSGSPAQAVALSAVLAPNPVPAAGQGAFSVAYRPAPGGLVVARLYNLAGELIAESQDPAGLGLLHFAGGQSGGIYLLDFEVREGAAVLARRVLKVAVVR